MSQHSDSKFISVVPEQVLDQETLKVKHHDWKKELLVILLSKPGRIFWACVVALIVLRTGINLVMHRQVKASSPSVTVAQPEFRTLDNTLNLPGNIEAVEQANLYAHVGGYLRKLYVDEGDFVKKGQLLAEIDAPDVVQEYRKVKAGYDLKEVTLRRYIELLREQVISQQEFDTTQAEADEAKARLDNAASNLSYTRITAPFAGSIARRFKYPGDLISVGTKGNESPIFILVNEKKLRVAINVPQNEVANIKIGHPVDVRLDSVSSKSFHGAVSRLDALMDDATKTQRVLIDLDADARQIHAGMFASVTLHTEHKDHVLTIPKLAVQAASDQPSVFVARDGNAKRIPVTLGMSEGALVEVTSGLALNDRVILLGGAQVSDGVEITVSDTSQNLSNEKH